MINKSVHEMFSPTIGSTLPSYTYPTIHSHMIKVRILQNKWNLILV